MRNEGTLQKGITIDAAAQGDFKPDLFELEVTFEAEYETREECIESYNKDYALVKEALIKLGMPEEAITTGPFIVRAHYEWIYEKVEEPYARGRREEYRRVRKEISGYEYEGSLSVERPMDLQLVGAIWSTLYEIEGDFGFEFEFKLEHPEIHERELLEQAVAEARERAEVLASAAGVTLGVVEAIHHEYRYARRSGSRIEYREHEVMYCASAVYDEDIDATPDINPEEITVSCSVTLRWALE